MSPALSTGHVTAALSLSGHDTGTEARSAARFLPGGWHLHPDTGAPGASRLVVEHAATRPEVTVCRHTVRLRLPAAAITSTTLAYATYTALERARQHQQMLTLHGNAMISPGGHGIVLLGTKGAGKTSTVLALGERGWTHAGDDLIVLAERRDHLAVLPGKPTAAIRPRTLAHWDHPKPLVDLTPFATAAAAVSLLVRLTVHPAHTGARLAPATPFNANEQLRLSEATARYISGLPTPLTGPTTAPYAPVWPLDTPALARWRAHLIHRLEHSPFVYLHAPSAEAAADLIAKEIST